MIDVFDAQKQLQKMGIETSTTYIVTISEEDFEEIEEELEESETEEWEQIFIYEEGEENS